MIPCQVVAARLSDLCAGELPQALAEATRAHAAECPACGRALRELGATVSLLRRAPAGLPPDFEAALHRRLVAAGSPPPSSALLARLGGWLRAPRLSSLLAAGLAVALVAALVARPRAFAPGDAGGGLIAPIYRVPANKLAVVKIEFVAEQPVDEVEYAIALPEGLHFVSAGRELPDREFRFRGPLDRGTNPIPIAVRGKRAGRFRIQASATGAGVEVVHDIVLEVTGT